MTSMRAFGKGLLCVVLAGALAVPLGCGGDFLGLEDYQRDLLMGGLAAALLFNQEPADGGEPTPGMPVPGPDGPEGPRGLPGAQGPEGPEGPEGPQGPEGPAGAEGPAGPEGPAGSAGSAGLSCWDLNGNGEPDQDSEDSNGDGAVDVRDCRGDDGRDGGSGSPGSDGPQGPDFFDIFIDDFFAGPATGSSSLPLDPYDIVSIEEPALQSASMEPGDDPDAIGYRVAIPEMYQLGNDVTMRIFFHRIGPPPSECFVFQLDARRLRHGLDIEEYGDRCWIRIDIPEAQVAIDGEEDGMLLVVDLPVNGAVGLASEDDDPLVAGHFLAFELSTYWADGGLYHLVGVEFFESPTGSAGRSGARVFTSEDNVECL